MKRVLAVAVACLLMAGALLLRSAFTDDGDGDGDEPGSEPGGEDDLVVACVPELQEACEALDRPVNELRIQDPTATIADPDVDAWVTFDPWPAMADLDRFADPVAVADDDLAVLARSERVPPDCEPLTWTCLVDGLDADLVAVPDPGTALGALVLGHAAIDFFGPGLARNDFGDPDFNRRMRALLIGGDPFEDIRIGLPEPVATGTLAQALASLGTRSVVTGPGASPATVAVVVAGPQADRVAGEPSFTAALEELGWTLDPDAATTGLPNAGVLVALTQEYR